jgi:hypothetical protein
MYRILIILLFPFALLLTSCERTDSNFCHQMGRESGNLYLQSMGEMSDDSVKIWLSPADTVLYFEPVFYRIDDQETFDKLVNCNYDALQINFQDYTLLMGYFFEYSGQARITKQSFYLNCGYYKQNAHYQVNFDVYKVEANFKPIQYNAIVEKIPEGLRIGNSVHVNEIDDIPN